MDEIHQPHDSFFKKLFQVIEEAVSFILNYVPENIQAVLDIDTLEVSSETFIDEELQRFYSDIVYKVNIRGRPGYLYLLLDHKVFRKKLLPLI